MSDLKEERHKLEFTAFLKSFRNLLVISQEVSLFECILNVLRENTTGYYNTLIR